ncbi:MAG: NADH-quinone oxidoreductase subunit 5 family protein [Candidatus Baldrarchaeia archaeon]
MLPYAPWLCWLIPLGFAVLIPLADKIHPRVRDGLAILGSFLAMVFAASMIPDVFAGKVTIWPDGKVVGEIPYGQSVSWINATVYVNGNETRITLGAGVLVDPLSVFMANIVGIIGFLIMVYSLGYMAGEPDMRRYWFWMSTFIGSMILLVMADNLIQMFVGWELVGLCSWQLIAFWFKATTPSPVPDFKTEGEYNAHCGMKAWIMTRAGDICLLIAIAAIGWAQLKAGQPLTFKFMDLQESTGWLRVLADVGLLVPISVLMFGGPVGKSAQFPLHEWLPEAMAGPTTVSALIHAATMVKAGVYLVARMVQVFYLAGESAGMLVALKPLFITVAWIGCFTAFLAATQAMVSMELKKVLAYSTISQIGYMMLGLGAGALLLIPAHGYVAGTFHLMSHAVFKALLFLCAGSVLHATETKYMYEMGGLKEDMPITYWTMVIGAASLAAVPGLAGFFSKELILEILWKEGQLALFTLATVTAALTAFYSFRMIGLTFHGPKSEYIKKREEEGKHVHEAPPVMWVPLVILAVASIVLGWLGPYYEAFATSGRFWVAHELGSEVTLEKYAHYLTEVFATPTAALSLLMLVIGIVPAYYIYIKRKIDPAELVSKNVVLRALYTFLYNRWYINPFYYKVFLNGTQAFSQRFRKLQTGILNVNVILMLIGFVAFIAYLVFYLL